MQQREAYLQQRLGLDSLLLCTAILPQAKVKSTQRVTAALDWVSDHRPV